SSTTSTDALMVRGAAKPSAGAAMRRPRQDPRPLSGDRARATIAILAALRAELWPGAAVPGPHDHGDAERLRPHLERPDVCDEGASEERDPLVERHECPSHAPVVPVFQSTPIGERGGIRSGARGGIRTHTGVAPH